MTTTTALFDIDGTLVDSNYLHVDAWLRAFSSLGVGVDAWRVHRAIGQDTVGLLTSLAGERDAEWNDRARDRHRRAYAESADRLRAFPGARELIETLNDRGVRVVLATSAPADELEMLRTILDVEDAISAVTSADDVDRAKPHPGIIEVALGRAQASADHAVFIGDATWDMIAATRAGVRAIGVRSGGIGDNELRATGATRVFEDVREIASRLDELRL